MRRLASVGLVAVVLPLISCLAACAGGSMRVVQETPSGGTVAVQGQGDGAHEKAEKYMGAQCPFGYDILGTQRSPDDQQTIRYSCRLPAKPDAAAKTRDVKEVAIHI
jgi:hypothetical protein